MLQPIPLDALGARLDFVFLVHGALLALWASAVFGLARHRMPGLSRWYGWGASAWALALGCKLLELNAVWPSLVDWLLPAIVSLGSAALLEGARRTCRERTRLRLSPWVHVLPVSGIGIAAAAGGVVEAWVWGVHAGLAAVLTNWGWNMPRASSRGGEYTTAGIGLVAYTVAQAFGAITQGHDAVAVLACLFLVPVVVTSIDRYTQFRQRLLAGRVRPNRLLDPAPLVVLGSILLLAWFGAEWMGARSEHNRRNEMMMRARLAAAAVPVTDVEALSWSDSDLDSEAYQRLKYLMTAMAEANRDLRFVLLAGWREDTAVFLVDSENPESVDYSPPGQIYTEAPASYQIAMAARAPFVQGPIVDRWGTWIVASIPLELPDATRAVNAELNIDAGGWASETRAARLPALLIALCVMGIVLTAQHGRDRVNEAMARLIASEQHKTTLVEGSPDVVLLVDPLGRCVSINRNGREAFGAAAHDVVGQNFERLWPEAEQAALRAAAEKTLAGTPWHGEAESAGSAGREITWRIATNPVFDPSGQVESFVLICTDITERKAAERQLRAAKEGAEQATRAKSEFLAVMSHEIRTPLGAVIGLIELLRQDPPADERQHYIELARQSAESLLHILDDILDAAKVESGRLTLETIGFDLRQEIAKVMETMGIRAAEKQLELRCVWEADTPPLLLGDPTRIKQILSNLISNAVKFTSHGSVIVRVAGTRVTGKECDVRISVTDTGVGMAPEVQRRIFQDFAQGDASTTRQYGGTGLGLSIVRGLVERMGGRVECSSRPGAGSTFEVELRLPIATPADLPRREDARAVVAQGHVRRLKLLLAEDDEVNREYISATLRRLGHEVRHVPNGREAVAALECESYDAVLMDHRMPVMDGLQATRLIRSASGARHASVYIIALTANASGTDRAACLEAGMNDFLAKPARAHELQAALVRAGRPAGPMAVPEGESTGLSEEALLAQLENQAAGAPARIEASPAVVRSFMVETEARLGAMRRALSDGRMNELSRLAHSVKGGAGYVAAVRLSTTAAELERVAEDGSSEAAARLLTELEEEFHRLAPALTPPTEYTTELSRP